MADIVAEIPTKRRSRGNRKALKETNPSTNEANIIAGKISESSSDTPISAQSENLSQPKKKEKAAASKKQQQSKQQQSFEKDLLEMQEKLQQLRLEKEKTEELLKAKDEILKQKEEELENRGKVQEKLQIELKKLQKLKEFKPTMVSLLISYFNSYRSLSSFFQFLNLFLFIYVGSCLFVYSCTMYTEFAYAERKGTRKEGQEEKRVPGEEKAFSPLHFVVQRPMEWGTATNLFRIIGFQFSLPFLFMVFYVLMDSIDAD